MFQPSAFVSLSRNVFSSSEASMEAAWNGKEGKERTLRNEQFTTPADQGLFRWWVKVMKLPQIPGEREKRRRRRTVLVLVVLMLASVRRNQALRASLPIVRSVEEPPKLSYALSLYPSLSFTLVKTRAAENEKNDEIYLDRGG
jgi:hypothetical protein